MFTKMSVFYDKETGKIRNVDGGEITVEERYLDDAESIANTGVLVKDFNMVLFKELWMYEVVKYKVEGSEEIHEDVVLKAEYEQYVTKPDWRLV